MKVSDDAKATVAALFRTWGMKPERCWEEVNALIAAAPAGDTAQTAEPTEKEWEQAWYGTPRTPFAAFAARMTAEAHRLAALRVNTPGPEAAKERV